MKYDLCEIRTGSVSVKMGLGICEKYDWSSVKVSLGIYECMTGCLKDGCMDICYSMIGICESTIVISESMADIFKSMTGISEGMTGYL